MTLGKFLKQAREAQALTQKQVAEHFKYETSQYVSNFERGICSFPIKDVPKLARLYKINPADIYLLMRDRDIAKIMNKYKKVVNVNLG